MIIRKNRNGKRKGIALFEIFVMVTATIAFAFIMNAGLGSALTPAEIAQINAGKALGKTDFEIAQEGGFSVADVMSAPGVASTAASGAAAIPPPTAPAGTQIKIVDATGKVVSGADKTNTFYLGGEMKGKSFDVVSAQYTGKIAPNEVNALTKNSDGTSILKTEKGDLTLTKDQTTAFENSVKDAGGKLQGQTETSVFGMKFFGGTAHLVQGLEWSLFVVGAIQLIGRLFGASNNLVNSLSIAAFAGIMSWKGILAGLEYSGTKSGLLWNSAGFIGLGVAALVFILLYKESKQKTVTYTCLPWEAPIGGKNCEKCNADPFKPCTEYRCKALGQACQLLNPETGNETCAWVSKFDVNSPTIKTNDNVLRPIGLAYVPNTGLRPGMTGVKVINQSRTDGCLQAFTKLQFGIYTNEPAQCKVEVQHTTGIKDMTYYMGESNLYGYNHTQTVKLPRSPAGNESGLPTLNSDGSYSMYVRCQDANGNQNVDEFVFSYCVDKSPDTTPTTIEGTSISSGSYVRYAVDTVPMDVYTNELADCRWSRIDEAYDDMKNDMNCNRQSYQVNANLQYTCSGNLTGIKDMVDNKFFFRCKDSAGNMNAQSYPFVLKGSQLLSVKSTAPNGTIYGSTSTTTVTTSIETSNGAESGKATCYYYPTTPSGAVSNDNFLQMFSTNDFVSKQDLDLIGGNYMVYFRCVDSGGNIASSNTTFSLVVDKAAPVVTRVYRELPDALKIVTNEDAQCAYSLTTCNYNVKDGIAMVYANSNAKNVHLSQWKAGQTYYIKCSDFYGNEPAPDQCNIVAGAAQLSSAN